MDSNYNPAKILLFGEYSILHGSKALALPYPIFSGHLNFPDTDNTEWDDRIRISNNILKAFLIYLKNSIPDTELRNQFNFTEFVRDLKEGLFFDSSIPQGLGLGSSGALVAAIYERYVNGNLRVNPDLVAVKKHLANLEAFFHKSSSGIDPLVSFYKKPVLIDGEQVIPVFFDSAEIDISYELVDSGTNRNTGNLISCFNKLMANDEFKEQFTRHLIPVNNICIEALLENRTELFFEKLKELSVFQFSYFKSFIPRILLPQWEKGLKTGSYYKLCGAGGGGYLLRFSRKKFKNSEISFVI